MRNPILIVCVLFMTSASVRSEELFSSFDGVPASTFGISSQVFSDFPPGSFSVGADDFEVLSNQDGWTIKRINVQGLFFNVQVAEPTPDSINIYILGNNNGQPDTTDLAGVSIYAAENLNTFTNNNGNFSITLPGSGVNLPAGTYWLAVQPNMPITNGAQWGWIESSADGSPGTANGAVSAWFQSSELINMNCIAAWGQRISDCDIGGTSNPQDPDLAFQLEGTQFNLDVIFKDDFDF